MEMPQRAHEKAGRINCLLYFNLKQTAEILVTSLLTCKLSQLVYIFMYFQVGYTISKLVTQSTQYFLFSGNLQKLKSDRGITRARGCGAIRAIYNIMKPQGYELYTLTEQNKQP